MIFYHSAYAYNYNYQKAIKQAIQEVDTKVDIGIKIRNLATGKIIYERNSASYYNFASSLKFITVWTLRQYLGHNYQFISRILQKDNDYYLEINDPNFSTDDLDIMIKALKEKSNHDAKDFYIIKSQFDLPAVIKTRMIEDSKYCYRALVTKVHVNKNCMNLQVNPDKLVKNKIHIQPKGLVPYKIINNATTIPIGYQDRLNIVIKDDNLLVNGTLSQDHSNFIVDAVANDHLNYIKLTLYKLLDKYDIKVTGKVLYGSKPHTAEEIVHSRKSFDQVASHTLKMSDNYVADYLLAEFATIYGITEWSNAGLLLKKYIAKHLAINLDNTLIADGSGLSRYNLLTPIHFDEFLIKIYKHKDFDTIKCMLARPGEPGTLEKRFKGVNIFAKTGSMAGISSLIGYVFDKNQVPYSFVIVSNNYLGSKAKYAKLEEDIIRILLKE